MRKLSQAEVNEKIKNHHIRLTCKDDDPEQGAVANFVNCDISGLCFKNARLCGVDFTGSNCTGTDFTKDGYT